jgi:hypothetical protein
MVCYSIRMTDPTDKSRDGLREAIEALAWAPDLPSCGVASRDYDGCYVSNMLHRLRCILAEHPATGDEERLITPGGNPTCLKCGRWYGPGVTHVCPEPDAGEVIAAHDAKAKAEALRERVDDFLFEATIALRAASTIGERSCRDGDHLNYGNHDRLIAEATRLRAALADLEVVDTFMGPAEMTTDPTTPTTTSSGHSLPRCDDSERIARGE